MRTPVMATYAEEAPFARTVVLREADTQSYELLFFTDIRSHKVGQLREQSQVASLYWDPGKKIQIRCRGKVALEQGTERCQEFWSRLNGAGRRTYATVQEPGSKVTEYTTGLPEGWSDDWPPENTDFAFTNFALLIQEVTEMDVLHLEQEGHQRALFARQQDDSWDMTWLIP